MVVPRSPSYWVRAYLRRFVRDVLAVRAAPLTPRPAEPGDWTTATFLGVPVLDLARRAAANRGARVRRQFRDGQPWGGATFGAYDAFESAVLLEMMATADVATVVEVAPNRGYSTALIQDALREVDAPEHRSYELDDFDDAIHFTLARYGGTRGWTLHRGDYRELVGEESHARFLEAADLAFVDADHRREFGEWYVNELGLFDRLRPGALVQIHDMYPEGHPGRAANPEAEPVFEWLRANRDQVEVFWCWEMCRRPELVADVPEWMLYDHGGNPAENPALWIRRVGE